MWKEAALLVSSLVCVSSGVKAQDKPSDFKVPAEDASRKNPVAVGAEAIAQGKQRYAIDCAVCHGTGGDGKGDVVDVLKLKLPDWHDPNALKDFSDGELFYIISKGKDPMPGETDRVKPELIWQMVIYIRSLSKTAPPPKDAKPTA
jgi:mono/diheme cytochrome c family protein